MQGRKWIDYKISIVSRHRDSNKSNYRSATAAIENTTTRGLLETDHVILNQGQVTWTTTKLAPSPSPNYHTTPTGGRSSSRRVGSELIILNIAQGTRTPGLAFSPQTTHTTLLGGF
ncbi:hypothetical protein TNCV_83461 [Trichonephila clavipes]|nr:hypothetical protein TNCV_83461 [Trichonephila clavipes]